MLYDIDSVPAMTTAPALDGYNPLAPDQLADPYPAWRQAMKEAPVFYMPGFDMWAITRHEDVLAVLRDTDLFSSAGAVKGADPPEELAGRLPHGYAWDYPTLINLDPPAHTRIRRLCQQAFGPRHVKAREAHIRAIGDDLVNEFADREQVDIVPTFSDPLPLRVVTSILGVPVEDSEQFAKWTDDALRLLSPMLDPQERRERAERAADFHDYCQALVEQRRAAPRDDLVSSLIAADGDGEEAPLTTPELVGIISQLLIAGGETTSNLISFSLLYLLADRDLYGRVVADRELIPAVVEETLRRRCPSKGLFRRTTRPTTLGGVPLSEGAVLHVLFSAANHDESVFPNPDSFELCRANIGQHVGFGRWTHFCLGAPLARAEGRIALEQLLQRLPDLRLAPDQRLEYVPSLGTQSLVGLQLRWA